MIHSCAPSGGLRGQPVSRRGRTAQEQHEWQQELQERQGGNMLRTPENNFSERSQGAPLATFSTGERQRTPEPGAFAL